MTDPDVLLPPARRFDLLAVVGALAPMQALLDRLRAEGFGVDIASDLAAARQHFFGAGGHHCVMIGPDVPPGVAAAIVASLREVDPDLPAVSFGPVLAKERAQSRTASLTLHPGSRAGTGALLRFLRSLPERG